MSKKQTRSVALGASDTGGNTTVSSPGSPPYEGRVDPDAFYRETWWFSRFRDRQPLRYLRAHLAATLIIAFLSIGALGAVLKYLDEDARAQKRLQAKDRSLISSINPFLVDPTPTPVTLSKEYIYAGSRLLAVEDANANAAPPADLAVWRPSSGTWYVLGGPNSQQTFFQWGSGGDPNGTPPTGPDTPVPGDFDGDGKTDFSIFRPTTNTWWVFKSSDSTSYTVTFGTSGDLVAPADYDGDGKTDLAVYRQSNGTWYIFQSCTGTTAFIQFGLSTDVPTPADYDGDGKADVAVWRDSTHTFYSKNSTDGIIQSPSFGSTGDKPVSADYDGDGKANFALRSGASWIILYSGGTTTTTPSGDLSTDMPVQNDYDGDGKVDIAVWRPSNGTWYIRKSSDSTTRTQQWGLNGDIPVPAYYRR
jgi:hypothetical protein